MCVLQIDEIREAVPEYVAQERRAGLGALLLPAGRRRPQPLVAADVAGARTRQDLPPIAHALIHAEAQHAQERRRSVSHTDANNPFYFVLKTDDSLSYT